MTYLGDKLVILAASEVVYFKPSDLFVAAAGQMLQGLL